MHHMKIFLMICLFFCNFAYGQNYNIFYDYKFVPDSNKIEIKLEQLMVLNISQGKSEYFSREKFEFDSIRDSEKKRGIYEVKPSKKILITERIVTYNSTNTVNQISTIGSQLFQILDDRQISWEIFTEFKEISHYKAQKAVTYFGGREWIAWFTSDIPIQDGPHKFRGLPGLVLEVQDSQKYHTFAITSLKKSFKEFVYPESETYVSLPKIDYSQYRVKYLQFRADPVGDLAGKIPDQPDQYGNMRTGTQILNEFRQKEIKRLEQDNNILELDLLKKK